MELMLPTFRTLLYGSCTTALFEQAVALCRFGEQIQPLAGSQVQLPGRGRLGGRSLGLRAHGSIGGRARRDATRSYSPKSRYACCDVARAHPF